MYGIIYKATGPTGKVYVGQTVRTLNRRKSQHAYRAMKKDRRSAFQVALLEHGVNAFQWERIDAADTADELDAKEKAWIARYGSMNPDKGYNSTNGGIKYTPSPETRLRISAAQKGLQVGKKHPMFGKHPSKETRQKMSEAQSGVKHPMFGKHPSVETLKKLSEAHKGLKAGEKHHNAKITEAIVRQIKIDLQAGMGNLDVAQKYGVSKGNVSKIKTGKTWKNSQNAP